MIHTFHGPCADTISRVDKCPCRVLVRLLRLIVCIRQFQLELHFLSRNFLNLNANIPNTLRTLAESVLLSKLTESSHSKIACVGESSGLDASRKFLLVTAPSFASISSIAFPTTSADTLYLLMTYEYRFLLIPTNFALSPFWL